MKTSKRRIIHIENCISIFAVAMLCSVTPAYATPSRKSSSAGSSLGDAVVWIFSHIPIILLGICVLIIIGIIIKNRQSKSQNSSNASFSVSISPVRTVYDEQQRVYRQEVISDTSNGRLIDGHPLRTREDWDRWSKYDHEARDCADTFRKCERELESKYCQDPAATLQRAKSAYARYENLCTTYGMWNNLIQDHAHYIPTSEQKQRSKEMIDRISALVPAAQAQKELIDKSKDVALSYLETLPEKTAYKTDLTRHLSSEMEITPSEAGKILRILYNLDILRESKNDQGRIIVRKARKRAN